MDKIIAGAGKRGLKVILDNHRFTTGDGPEDNGLWYTEAYPESRWTEDRTMLATRYNGNLTVTEMDLRHEPFEACWGCGDLPLDWRLAAERAGNAILAVNPDLLMLAQGVSEPEGRSTLWGGNLAGAQDHPVRLDLRGRLIYSVHEDPGSVAPQPWLNEANYSENLPSVGGEHWGYLVKENIATILIVTWASYGP